MDRSLIQDIKDSFKSKGFEYVSIKESTTDQYKSILTYKDDSAKTVTKEISMPLADLEDTLAEIEVIDPDDLATYLLSAGPSSP
jgi:hypothetical protein